MGLGALAPRALWGFECRGLCAAMGRGRFTKSEAGRGRYERSILMCADNALVQN